MEKAINNGDPAFLETCHRWLLFHFHCIDCGQSEDTCQHGKVCTYGKSTFAHVRGCTRTECSFPRCDLVKSILRHHQACKDEDCQVCSPVCRYQARSKAPPPSPPPPPPPLHPPIMGLAPTLVASPMQQCSEHRPQPPQLSEQPSPQSQKRSSSKAELDVVQTHRDLQQQQQQQEVEQRAGLLFEARHREHKRHLCGSLSRTSGTLDTTTCASGASNGGCKLASAASGSIEAVTELRALQLGRSSERQAEPSTDMSCKQPTPCPSFARQSAPASLEPHLSSSNSSNTGSSGSNNCSSSCNVGGSSLPLSAEAAQLAAPMPGFRVIAGMQQQQQQQQLMQPPLQQQQQLLSQQQCSMPYGPPALTVLLQPPAQQQQQPVAPPVVQPALQPQTALQLQQQLLPDGHRQAIFGPVQFLTPVAFQASSQLLQPPQQQQSLIGDARGVVADGNGGLSTAGGMGLQTNTTSYMSLPYGTWLQPSVQLGAAAPGLAYTVVHHHFGSAGHAGRPNMLLSPAQQQHQQQAPPQQHALGLMMGAAEHVTTGPGLLMGPQQVTGMAPMSLGCGSAATSGTSSGASTGLAAAWGSYQCAGHQRPLLEAQQHLQGSSAATSGGDVAPMLLVPQLAGAI
ncbi:hypothetical protein PLESTB_001392500 [Pleodorina starrii]|uniref:histone acetyltransferase n=1 Tax=Pleodorina starrii TaxID=330485 RepID=A0A9W6F7N3_9CHLO|nr:hypothetical protein PLESTM_000540000 [Pleodorina starrii]GLC58711.1 hypothetical protein PLESTB_001392500 [Pleodorina starrii]GLC75205.1 hypothetical protein PLESTF_001606700 [Pleodorina starrii]